MTFFPALRRALLLSFLFASATVASRADELVFPNGDRLSGTIKSESPEAVVFLSDVLGEIKVPPGRVRVVRGDPENGVPLDALTGVPSDVAASIETEPKPKPSKESPPAKRSAPESNPTPAPAPAPPDEALAATPKKSAPWKGRIEFGYRQQDGRRQSTSFDFRSALSRTVRDHTLNFDAKFLYGEQDGRVNSDRYDGSFRWRRQLGERMFTQTLTSYFRDDLKNVEHNLEQNVGAGVRLMKTPKQLINVGLGVTGQYREVTDIEPGTFALAEFFQDYSFKISSRLSLNQNASAQYSGDGRGRFTTVSSQPSATGTSDATYKFKFNTALQGKMTERISLNLRYEYEFDNAVANREDRADQRVTSSIAYGF